jgi:hypothetical protein
MKKIPKTYAYAFIGKTIVVADLYVSPLCVNPNDPKGERIGLPLPKIVQWFKTMTTNENMRQVKRNLYKPIHKRLWQRNYYEHVIRNEDDLKQTREYILYNPLKWEMDEENPENISVCTHTKNDGRG